MTLLNILAAVFTAGLPLFLLSFALVSVALHRGWMAGESVKDLQGSLKALGKAHKDKQDSRRVDPAMGKWFSFGGGFYGLVALYTWLRIEWDDVADFLGELGDVVFDLDPGSLIGLGIELLVESFINFGLALGWPAYWLAQWHNPWLLLLAAYGGYWLGFKAAQYAWQRGWVSGAIDRAVALVRRGD